MYTFNINGIYKHLTTLQTFKSSSWNQLQDRTTEQNQWRTRKHTQNADLCKGWRFSPSKFNFL